MSTPLSAKNANVRINGTVVTAKKWSVAVKCGKLEVTNFETGGFEDSIGGILSAEISIDADWDSASDPFGNPPNLIPGQVLTSVVLYTNTTSSVAWNFPSVYVEEATMGADVKGQLTFSCKLCSKGSFTAP